MCSSTAGSPYKAVPRAALTPHPIALVCPLTCPHEALFAIAVVDIALLLWKKKRGCQGQLPQGWGVPVTQHCGLLLSDSTS